VAPHASMMRPHKSGMLLSQVDAVIVSKAFGVAASRSPKVTAAAEKGEKWAAPPNEEQNARTLGVAADVTIVSKAFGVAVSRSPSVTPCGCEWRKTSCSINGPKARTLVVVAGLDSVSKAFGVAVSKSPNVTCVVEKGEK